MVLLRYIVGQERILNQLIFCAVGANPYVHTIVTPTAWLDCRCEALVRQAQLRLPAEGESCYQTITLIIYTHI
jgi:hypothetical protein